MPLQSAFVEQGTSLSVLVQAWLIPHGPDCRHSAVVSQLGGDPGREQREVLEAPPSPADDGSLRKLWRALLTADHLVVFLSARVLVIEPELSSMM